MKNELRNPLIIVSLVVIVLSLAMISYGLVELL